MQIPDYYKILGIPQNATNYEIKKAYKEKALKYHPDVCNNEHSLEMFQLLNMAYHTLIDPALRKKYDLKRNYPDCFFEEKIDPRKRHPSDAAYYKRRDSSEIKPNIQDKKIRKSLKNFNTFIFYSISSILAFGIILGFIDIFTNFDFSGLLFSIFTMSLLIIGVRIIRKERTKYK